MRPIIAIINQDLARHPDLAHLKSPVTVLHTPYECPRCKEDCWIGPKQLAFADTGNGEVLCYKCLFADPEVRAMGTLPTVTLNPGIEDAPRRFPT